MDHTYSVLIDMNMAKSNAEYCAGKKNAYFADKWEFRRY